MLDWKDRIKVLMKKKRWTQTDLANEMGMSRAAVSLWLGNKNLLSDKALEKIQYQMATIFDVPLEYIVSGADSRNIPSKIVPVLKKRDLEDWLLHQQAEEDIQWITCPVECSTETFCIVQKGNAMDSCGRPLTSFPDSSYVFVDPSLALEVGKVSLFKDKELVLGTFNEFMGEPVLEFNNMRYPNLSVEPENYAGRPIASLQRVRDM